MFKHSFAVMAYKDSPFLSECLNSVKNQNSASEIYICTSTPSEYIFELARKHDVEVHISESDKGIAYDWNFSLKQAKTKYVTLAHQDDIYLPNYSAECIRSAEKFQNTLICFTGYSEIRNGRIISQSSLLRIKRLILWFFMPLGSNIRSKFMKKRLLSTGCPIAAPSVMFNLDKLKQFEFSNDYSINLDWDAWYRMAEINGRFVYVKSISMLHRIHSDSATTAGLKVNKRQNEDLRMFRRFWPDFLAVFIARVYARSYSSNIENLE